MLTFFHEMHQSNLFYKNLFIKLSKLTMNCRWSVAEDSSLFVEKEKKYEKKVHFIFNLITKIEEYNLDWIQAELSLWSRKLPLSLCISAAVSPFS